MFIGTDNCKYNERQSLALSSEDFDRIGGAGWRNLAYQEGCLHLAADLIAKYRITNKDRTPILLWHEGQLRATLGDYRSAIRLMKKSRLKGADPYGYNIYTDATIAYLERDYSRLRGLATQLNKVKWEVGVNLNALVVNRLVKCYDRPYKEAYIKCDKQ
jgi:hypothetical protein